MFLYFSGSKFLRDLIYQMVQAVFVFSWLRIMKVGLMISERFLQNPRYNLISKNICDNMINDCIRRISDCGWYVNDLMKCITV